ncbi:hypothetical protein MMC10_003133 [Thelotrema lepadinum]|nr:hypothetical protein [Thelotrema lepadinum]
MESTHRQDQDQTPDHHHHQQPQEHLNNSGSVNSPAYPQFSNQSNNAPGDEFSTFFNVPGDDGPGQSFNASWDPSSIIDPRLQQQSFAQHTNTWNQPSLPNTSHLGNHGQGLNSTDFQNAFATNSSPYFSPGYNNSQYQPYQGGPFNPISYGSGPLLGNPSYPGANGQSFGNHALQGQTIAPSALQSYPTPFGNLDKNQFSALTARNSSGSIGASMETQPRRKPFDEDFALNAAIGLAPGKIFGNVAIRDSKALAKATESEPLGRWVWIGDDTLDSDDPKGVLPKITARKSTREMKRTIMENQGDEPFDARIRPAMKKLKMSSKSQKSQTPAVPMGTQVASPSSDEESPSSEEGSDDDSEYDEGQSAQISPLPATKPKESDKAMEYEVIKVLWHKRRVQLTGGTIRDALGSYWNLIKPVRDAWKIDYSAISEAEAKNDKAKAEQHRTLANRNRKILEAGFQATAEHGHQDIVSKLSENNNLFLSFYQLLVDRFKEGDINGRTVTVILDVMVRCTSMNQALLEKTKLDKVLPKLVKRGNEATQKLVQSVNKIVSLNSGTESARIQAKPVKQETKPPHVTTTSGTGLLNGAKRPKELPPARKSVSTGQSKSTSVNSSKGAVSSKSNTGLTQTLATKADLTKGTPSSSNPLASTQKTKPVVPKPTSLLTGLQSASKKPGTSIASQKSSQAGDTKSKMVEAKKETPSETISKPSFSFGDILANLDKPKVIEMTKKSAEDRPPETEEEKKKRLRKEARRHLRVKWKPEASLVETRLFRHDPEEEVGHDSSMIRDATDVKNEGQMLKLHKDLEVDEEDDGMEEVELAPWHPLSMVDFSALPGQAQSDNFDKYGGKRVALSPERFIQEQRELTTLIAIYSLASDIPYSPREPTDPHSGPLQEEKSFGEGGSKWDKVKSRERAFFASRAANQYLQAPASASGPNINSILSILSGRQQSTVPQQFLQPMAQMNPQSNQAAAPQNSVLESIFAKFTPQAQAPVAPTPQIDPSYMSAISIFNQQLQLQQQQQQQPAQYHQAPVYQPPPAATPQTPDLSALLAQFSQQTSSVQQPAYNYQSSYGNENDRKRPYDDGSNQEQQGESKRNKGKKVWQIFIIASVKTH